jgi:hypothetical protein
MLCRGEACLARLEQRGEVSQEDKNTLTLPSPWRERENAESSCCCICRYKGHENKKGDQPVAPTDVLPIQFTIPYSLPTIHFLLIIHAQLFQLAGKGVASPAQ